MVSREAFAERSGDNARLSAAQVARAALHASGHEPVREQVVGVPVPAAPSEQGEKLPSRLSQMGQTATSAVRDWQSQLSTRLSNAVSTMAHAKDEALRESDVEAKRELAPLNSSKSSEAAFSTASQIRNEQR